jgi:hypothetical protein
VVYLPGQFRFGSWPDAARPGCFHSGAGAFDDEAAFKFGQGGKDMKYQFAARCAGVDFLGKGPEMNPAPVKVIEHAHEVALSGEMTVKKPRERRMMTHRPPVGDVLYCDICMHLAHTWDSKDLGKSLRSPGVRVHVDGECEACFPKRKCLTEHLAHHGLEG